MSQTSDMFHILIWGEGKSRYDDAMIFLSKKEMEEYLINAYREEYFMEGEEPHYAQIRRSTLSKVGIKLGIEYE